MEILRSSWRGRKLLERLAAKEMFAKANFVKARDISITFDYNVNGFTVGLIAATFKSHAGDGALRIILYFNERAFVAHATEIK